MLLSYTFISILPENVILLMFIKLILKNIQFIQFIEFCLTLDANSYYTRNSFEINRQVLE